MIAFPDSPIHPQHASYPVGRRVLNGAGHEFYVFAKQQHDQLRYSLHLVSTADPNLIVVIHPGEPFWGHYAERVTRYESLKALLDAREAFRIAHLGEQDRPSLRHAIYYQEVRALTTPAPDAHGIAEDGFFWYIGGFGYAPMQREDLDNPFA